MIHDLRDWANRHPTAVGVGAIALLVILLGLGVMRMGSSGGKPPIRDGVWFYDVNTGKLFVAGVDQIPPIDTPSGAEAGVIAHVWSCGSCEDESSLKIAYLEKYTTEEAKEAVVQMNEAIRLNKMQTIVDILRAKAQQDMLIKRPEDTGWTPATSDAGLAMMEIGNTVKCPDDRSPQPCRPKPQ